MYLDIDLLNNKYSHSSTENNLQFKVGKGGIPVVEIKNKFSTALISLQGAHLLSWIPANQQDVIWVSDDAKFILGKSVRGGIPICWPWFGAHASNSSYPAHGFARTVMWDVVEVKLLSSDETQIRFKLDVSTLHDAIKAMYINNIVAEYIVTIGKTLKLELITINNSDETIILGEALHTYFSVSDISQVKVEGLDGREYLDKPDGFKRKQQNGDIQISAEVDRVYVQSDDEIVIHTPQRNITVSKQGSLSTIVWNPGARVAAKMGDLGEDGYTKMLCVESANAADDVVSIAAGESHIMEVNYSL